VAVNSAAAGLFAVVKLILAKPGDEALIADPVDFLFERAVAAAGGVAKRYAVKRPSPDEPPTFSIKDMTALITPRTRLLCVCHPHNPLGRVWTRSELEAFVALAVKHNLTIMADEVWGDIVFADATLQAVAGVSAAASARTFTVRGFSKSFGLAGLRLGYVVAPTASAAAEVLAVTHADVTADGCSTLSQIAGLAAYTHPTARVWLKRYVAHLRRQRDYAVRRLNTMPGVRVDAPEGTFVLFPTVAFPVGFDEVRVVSFLEKEFAVAVVPGSPRFFGPGAAGCLRISLATSRVRLQEGLDRLERGLQALRAKNL
jgi:aspartate/methionine/tyrosine aminotransferase